MSGKPAARVSDPTACPTPGHGTNPITTGSSDVFFDGLPAAREGDTTACGGVLTEGLSSTVFINGKRAAMVGSVGTHGNAVIGGSGTIIIGDTHTPAPFIPPTPMKTYGFDVRVQLMNSATGTPLKSAPYVATLEDGTSVRGVTDSTGLSEPLGKKAQAQNIQFTAKPNWILRGE